MILDPLYNLRFLLYPDEQNATIDDFILEVESKYRGLGIPTLYGTLSILANKSVLYIAGRGIGKTRVITSIPDIQPYDTSKWDTFTMGELSDLCKRLSNGVDFVDFDGLVGKKLVFKVKDFSTLSNYHRELFLTICSKIISDGDYTHMTTLTPFLKFENCILSMLIAIQPKLYSLLCFRYTQWQSMSSDRFTKFLVINPLREGRTLDDPFVATLPKKILLDVNIPEDVDLTKLVKLFKGQISEGRAFLYARDYSKAMAKFQGKTNVEQEDVETFYKLFSPYLESFSKLQTREDLESPVSVSSGHMELLTEIGKYMEGVKKENLAKSLFVSVRHIERGIEFLMEKGLIRKNQDKYILSAELMEFFNWYKLIFSM
jgi:hypothetical protein